MEVIVKITSELILVEPTARVINFTKFIVYFLILSALM